MKDARPGAAGARMTQGGGAGGDGGTVGELLGGRLAEAAEAFLRAASAMGGSGPDAMALRAAVRGLSPLLTVFGPLLNRSVADPLRSELGWLAAVLAPEPAYTRKAVRLAAALDVLAPVSAGERGENGPGGQGGAESTIRPGVLAGHPGVPKARALLERQLTLARARAHTAALQELRSSRFHALADRLSLLASDPPLALPENAPGDAALLPCLGAAYRSLAAAVRELPLARITVPYHGDALRTAPEDPDEPRWRRTRDRARAALRARAVCAPLLDELSNRHPTGLDELTELLAMAREAAEAAAGAAAAATTPRITPATGYVLGVLHADQRMAVEAARYAFSRRWSHLAPEYDRADTEMAQG
ncbi:CHAD domain-containing protein [Phaeacidiphilus oryzae]|uniref:CHAD domain-containing protein n=1 Tax=Phaeacidiphilus oryzae TaxID=348818 RepID=UPI000A064C64|nr:CHAD domain-containing protein [Phaeacidiphilus oryzae]